MESGLAEVGGKHCGNTRLKGKSKSWEKVVLVKEKWEIQENPGRELPLVWPLCSNFCSVAQWICNPSHWGFQKG